MKFSKALISDEKLSKIAGSITGLETLNNQQIEALEILMPQNNDQAGDIVILDEGIDGAVSIVGRPDEDNVELVIFQTKRINDRTFFIQVSPTHQYNQTEMRMVESIGCYVTNDITDDRLGL